MTMRSLTRLAAGVAVALTLVSSAGQARAQGTVLPLPPADQQKLAANLGAGVVGAALPSERISDVSAYFPLHEKTFVFQVTSGSNTGQHPEPRPEEGAPAGRGRVVALQLRAVARRLHQSEGAAISSCRRSATWTKA